MTCCPYCDQPATMTIVATPDRVCVVHALEFWRGLMLYTKDRSDPCVKQERVCSCRMCEEAAEAYRRAVAKKTAGPAPEERFAIRMAS